MSSVESDPSKLTLFVGRVTVFVGCKITAVGGELDVVDVAIVVVEVVVVLAVVVEGVVVVVIGRTTSVAVVVSDKPLSSVTVKRIMYFPAVRFVIDIIGVEGKSAW